MTEKEFTDSLRSEYGITDYEALVDELDHAAQGRGEKVKATESVQDFMYRIGNLRNDIVTISREEGDPMEPSAVQKKFLKALSVGLRDDSIRLQLLPVLKNDKITDQEIRCEIKKIVARNKEHEKRMEGGSSKASVKTVGASQSKESADSAAVLAVVQELSAQMKELSTTQANEINTLKKQVEVLSKKITDDGGNGGARQGGPSGGGRIPRNLLNTCEDCAAANTGVRCQHCTMCCMTGRKRINCPRNE